MASKKCTCNIWMTLLALILLSVSLYLLATGFLMQFSHITQGTEENILTTLGWYFIGLIVLIIAKICKWKGHTSCPVHGNMYGK